MQTEATSKQDRSLNHVMSMEGRHEFKHLSLVLQAQEQSDVL